MPAHGVARISSPPNPQQRNRLTMSTLAQLVVLRATAVSEYQTARDAFKTKYVPLAALDRALANGKVGAQAPLSFGGERREMIALMQHPTAGAFLPGDW